MSKRIVDNPTIIQISESEMAELLTRLEGCSLPDADKALLSEVLHSHSWLYRTLKSPKLTIRKFKAMLFGSTEKDKTSSKKNADSNSSAAGNVQPDSEVNSEPEPANDLNPDLPGDSDPGCGWWSGRINLAWILRLPCGNLRTTKLISHHKLRCVCPTLII